MLFETEFIESYGFELMQKSKRRQQPHTLKGLVDHVQASLAFEIAQSSVKVMSSFSSS